MDFYYTIFNFFVDSRFELASESVLRSSYDFLDFFVHCKLNT